MTKHDDPYSLFPKNKFRVKMHHLHPGNSTKKQRGNSQYLSLLYITVLGVNGIDDYTLKVTAKCAPGDIPNRAKAREILRLKAKAVAETLGLIG